MAALTLFYSYAHEDEALRDQLEKHLVQLQRQGLIASWHDRKIPPGSVWADEIDVNLETASIILLLVSPDFLASNYCYEIEMKRALERHQRGETRVVPIILRPCDWQHSPLKDLQCLPRDGKPVTQWQDQDEVFLTITQGLRTIIEQQARPFVPLSPLNRQNRMRMLKQVRKIWIDGVLTQSLHNAARIELHLQDRPDVLVNPWRLQVQETDQTPKNLPDETTIVQVYDRADSELLILGEPGAGKTTLLLELARTLLERAEKDERLPMPIIFHLSSWAEKRQPLHVWLIDELRTKYQIPRKIAQGWIDTDQVLALLDGLDEVAKDVRSACVEQINNYYQSRLERGSSSIVVCCRSEEYAALSTRVMVQRAVSILPLTDEQIDAYLEQAGEQVKGLRQALDEDAELHSLACQPLMLNIFTLAYQGAQASDVPTGETPEEMRSTIFARYVERMLRRRGQSKRWELEQVIHWLTFLAKQMQRHGQTVFSVENLQATWLSEKRKLLYQWCVGLVGGLAFGVIVGLPFSLFVGLAGGLFNGLVFGLLTVPVFMLNTRIDPVEALTWSWKQARFGLFFGLLMGSFVGLPFSLFVGQIRGLLSGLVGELVFGLAFGLGVGLVDGLQGRQLSECPSLSSNEGIQCSGKMGLFIGLLSGLVGGLVSAPIGELIGGPAFALVFGLNGGLLFALVGGQSRGLRAFVMHFILRFFLSWRSGLPRDLVAFLDEATERLLLRKVGGSYIFVHRMLQDYFAELEEKDGSHRPR